MPFSFTSADAQSDIRVRNHLQKEHHIQPHATKCVPLTYLGSRSQATPISLVSSRGLFCVDIKYFSLSSNSLFWEKGKEETTPSAHM